MKSIWGHCPSRPASLVSLFVLATTCRRPHDQNLSSQEIDTPQVRQGTRNASWQTPFMLVSCPFPSTVLRHSRRNKCR